MEPSKQEAKSEKKQYGCTELLVRTGIGIAIIFIIDYSATYIFRNNYPAGDVTQALVPFQNNYLAQTDAFITSEGSVSEFTDDSGAAARFLGLCIIPFVGIMMLAGVLYAIPFTRKLVDYTWYAIFFSFFLLMIDALFFPPVMTVFDREARVMVVHRPSWMFFGTKTEIPFGEITGFTFEVDEVDGFDHYDDVTFADLYATTSKGKIFIGENQVGAHFSHDKIPVAQERMQEIDAAVKALYQLVGK